MLETMTEKDVKNANLLIDIAVEFGVADSTLTPIDALKKAHDYIHEKCMNYAIAVQKIKSYQYDENNEDHYVVNEMMQHVYDNLRNSPRNIK